MYSQGDERGILDDLVIQIFFAAQPWWAYFWWILHFFKFLLLPLSGILKA